ncbi:MAG: trypsin-like peptidase domain-containing protein [Armatimonadota bacterium]
MLRNRLGRHGFLAAWCFTLLALALAPAVAVSEKDAIAALEATQAGFRSIHTKVSPAVVSISSRLEVAQGVDPYEYLFGMPRRNNGPQYRNASGSGVIIRPEGIVLTNSHVVQNAVKVTVQLTGSEKALPAEVVKTDPRTDLAIVKITEKGTYPVAALGDATTVKVGDWAIAFGSPFRLSSTMTIGVISATGRRLSGPVGDGNLYRGLLQTDASINPGNSGGPLVNIYGQIIGINFMIFSPGDNSGSVGIGFAIPIDADTKRIIDTLAAGRAVERGRLGVYVKNLDAAMREAYGVPEGGVLVDSVVAGQAADKAGVKAEDVIIQVGQAKVTDSDQFVSLIEQTAPGTKVTLTIVRNKKEIKVPVTVGSATVTTADAEVLSKKVGMTVTALTAEMATRYDLPVRSGILVLTVSADSPAEEAGLRRGDIIQRVGLQNVATEEEFWGALTQSMAAAKAGVILRVVRGDRSTILSLPPIKSE